MPHVNDFYYFTWLGNEAAKETLVLLHGAGGTHLFWPPQLRRLPNLRVLAPDLPGHGRSGGNGLRSIEAYAVCVSDWLNKIGINRAHFCGHSMGSAIALQLALVRPNLVADLILIGAGTRLKVHPEILNKLAKAETFREAVEIVVSAAFADHTPARLKELAFQRLASTRQAILYSDFLACNDFDLMGNLARIGQPVLVICGDQDRLTPLRYAEYLVKQLPNAHLQIIEKAGHMVMLEKPVLIAELIQRFVSRLTFSSKQ